jgi:nitrite reductase/ring-hydroxylating ferredoxin subunit
MADPAPSLLQIGLSPALQERRTEDRRREWASLDALPDLGDGGRALEAVAGEDVLFLRLDGRVYAYRPACPGCGAPLADGVLAGTELTCAGCGHRYDVRRAGRCLDAPQLHLDPVPVLNGADGHVKVALA